MESLTQNPSLDEIIQKLNEIIDVFNISLPSTNSNLEEIKKVVSFGSDVLASKLNSKLWYFKTQEFMKACTELHEGESCFVLKNNATAGEGVFEYWYIHKTDDIKDIINNYVELADSNLAAVKLKDSTLKDLEDRVKLLSDNSAEIANLGTRITELSSETTSALNLKADLENGLVPTSQLPSYVDDVIEGWFSDEENPLHFYNKDDPDRTTPIPPESGKLYVNLFSNLQYRWGGSFFVEISKSLAIGETASTAFAGNRGKSLETQMTNVQGTLTGLENNKAQRYKRYEFTLIPADWSASASEGTCNYIFKQFESYHVNFTENTDIVIFLSNTATVEQAKNWLKASITHGHLGTYRDSTGNFCTAPTIIGCGKVPEIDVPVTVLIGAEVIAD